MGRLGRWRAARILRRAGRTRTAPGGEVGGAVAGLLEVEQRADTLFIINIELGREFRRHGLGSAIIRDIKASASNHGLPLELTVLRVNPARALYERLGFVEFDRSSTHHYMRWMPAGLHAGGRS